MADCKSVKRRPKSESKKGLECYAMNCYTYRNKISSANGITFHKFPDKRKHKAIYDKWVSNCGREGHPTQASRLCSKHFNPEAINRTLQKTQVRENAIPTLFENVRHKSSTRKSSMTNVNVMEVTEDKEACSADNARHTIDHAYTLSENDLRQRYSTHQEENERPICDLNVRAENACASFDMRNIWCNLTNHNKISQIHKNSNKKSSMTNVNVMQVTEDKEACSKDNARHTTNMAVNKLVKRHSQSESKKGLECYAMNCYTYRNRISSANGITFHKFPHKDKHKVIYDKWVSNCGREGHPTQASRLCSKHFNPEAINRTLRKTQLRENAIPTVFEHVRHKSPARKSSMTVNVMEVSEDKKACSTEKAKHAKQKRIRTKAKHAKEDANVLSENEMRQRYAVLQEENERLRKLTNNTEKRESRANRRIRAMIDRLAAKQ